MNLNIDNYLDYAPTITTLDDVKQISLKVNKSTLFSIIELIPNEELRISSIEYCKEFVCRILMNIKNRNLVIDFISYKYDETYPFTKNNLIGYLNMTSDELSKIIDNTNDLDPDLVLKIKDIDIRRKYVIKYLNSDKCSKETGYKLLAKSFSPNFIYELCQKYNIDVQQLIEYLVTIKDEYYNAYAKDLCMKINIPGISDECKTNIHSYKKRILNNIYISKKDLDKTISFGIELEAFHKSSKLYNMIGTMLGNWVVKEDYSFDDSTEIASPILHNQISDLKQLKFVCDFMQQNGFKETRFCGGHIHIGMDYFEEASELKMLYYIFCNCEYIFYQICNKENTIPRKNIEEFAINISHDISWNWNKISNIDDLKTLIDFLKSMQHNSRFFDINILNAGSIDKNTIEFRFPNGELDYEELMNNVTLITSLVEKSKELAHINSSDERNKMLYQLGNDIPDSDKLNILLSLLFTNNKDKEIFYNRFYSNNELTNNSKASIKDMCFTNIKILKI